VPVKEVFGGKTVWDGNVEVFDLSGHQKRPEPMHGHMIPTTRRNLGARWPCDTPRPFCRQRWQCGQQSLRSSAVANQQKPRKVGRPKLPKGEAKGKIVPIRFAKAEFERLSRKAKASDKSVSELIRSTLLADLEG